MSFNRRGGDRSRDRSPRPDRRGPPDWRPRERPAQDRFERPPDRDRDRDRPPPRRFERGDEGGMSIRLDPRRLGALKQLAAESDMRPGELVLRWVEERLDAARGGGGQGQVAQGAAGAPSGLASRIDELTSRVARLENAAGRAAQASEPSPSPTAADAPSGERDGRKQASSSEASGDDASAAAAAVRRGRTKRPVSRGTTNGDQPRVALHDEIIAVVAERGPMTPADLASAITERGRYSPPRSGKALDATTVSARVSNPTYRGRFKRRDGRIGLADSE